jgi:hypothetical protein
MPPSRVEIISGVSPGEVFTGQRTLQAIAEDDSGRVAKVSFFVSGALACVDPAARESGATFSCTWDTKNTAQGNHQLVATAQDEAGNTTASAPIIFSVGTSQAPVISAITVNPASVNEGQDVALSVTASDPQGDALTYAWSQVTPVTPVGTFTNGTAASATWRAPLVTATTTFTLRVTVSDGNGGIAERTADLQVVNVATPNQPPTVSASITGPTTVVAGNLASLSITASDPDGDTLTYAWSTVPTNRGTFSNTASASTTWRSPEISTATDFTVQVIVSDGQSTVTRTKVVRATVPTYATHIQPIWAQCTGCHDNSSPAGGMNLLSASSYNNLVNAAAQNSTCSTLVRVSPNQPDNSLLVRKISGTACGNRMPQDNPGYFVSNPGLITRIRSWILAGALNN